MGSIPLKVNDNLTSIIQLSQDHNVTLLPNIIFSTTVQVFNGVICKTGQLARCGTYVQVHSNDKVCCLPVLYDILIIITLIVTVIIQNIYGVFIKGFQTQLCQVCLIQTFEKVDVVNEFGCPLYMLLMDFQLFLSTSVVSCVSFVHECDCRCKFCTVQCPSFIEREQISVEGLKYVHDHNCNNLYCLNIFCMNQ